MYLTIPTRALDYLLMGIIAGVIAGLILVFLFGVTFSKLVAGVTLMAPDVNVERLGSSIKIPACPGCPQCPSAEATCFCPGAKFFEGCHIPEKYFEEKYTVRTTTGFSNIPTMVMGNKIITIDVKSEKELFVGCFYGFEREGELKVHRLMGVYPNYLLFRGDNSEGFEKVEFKDVKYLVREIQFK